MNVLVLILRKLMIILRVLLFIVVTNTSATQNYVFFVKIYNFINVIKMLMLMVAITRTINLNTIFSFDFSVTRKKSQQKKSQKKINFGFSTRCLLCMVKQKKKIQFR